MTVQGVNCLFCRRALEIPEKRHSKRKARVLSLIHKRLCSALKLDFPKEFRKWNFSKEPFPFCLSCQKVILRLCRFMDQLKAFELEISRCVSTLSMLTITSTLNSEDESQVTRAKECDVSNSCEIGRKFKEKHQYFRDLIIQRFSTKVRIKRSDQIFIPISDARRKAVSEVNLEDPHAVRTIENYADDDNDIDFNFSRVLLEPGSPPGSETWDSCPSPVECDPFPPDSAVPSNSTVLTDPSPHANVELEECVNKVSSVQEFRHQQRDSEEEIPEAACELDIKIEPLCDTGLVQACLDPTFQKCGSQLVRNKANAQRKRQLVPKKQNRVNIVQELGEGRYELNGFGFREFRKGLFQCSTCRGTFPFPSGWPEKKILSKWIYIRRHILRRHMSKIPASAVQLQPGPANIITNNQSRNKGKTDQEQQQQKPTSHEDSSLLDDPVVEPLVNSLARFFAGVEVSVGETKARCLKCGLEFERKAGGKSCWAQAQNHISDQHLSGRIALGRYPIQVVDKDQKLYRTMGHEYQELENGYECSTCKKIFPFAATGGRSRYGKWFKVKQHILLVHARQFRGRCEICNKDVTMLQNHMKRQHGGELGRKVCEVCGKEFKSAVHLWSHKSEVHGRSRKKSRIQCEDCGKTFALRQLKLHRRIHTGEKPYVCEQCGKGFRYKHVFNTHVASAHGERKFACDQCDWKFGVKFLLTRHVKQVHEGIKPPRPKKKKKVEVPREESEEETSEESDSDTSSADEEEA